MASHSRVPTFKDCNEPSQIESQSHNIATDVGRAVTDAVHERFRQDMVYCDNCREKFNGDFGSIHKHFDKSHPAAIKCIYCPGKVFRYYKVKNDDNKAEQFYYHRCRDWLEE